MQMINLNKIPSKTDPSLSKLYKTAERQETCLLVLKIIKNLQIVNELKIQDPHGGRGVGGWVWGGVQTSHRKWK